MEYSINLVNVEKEAANGPHRAYVVYRFAISNGSANTFGDVLLPEGGVSIIEQKGKDPQTAAKIALERLLKQGGTPLRLRFCSVFRSDTLSISPGMGITKHCPR